MWVTGKQTVLMPCHQCPDGRNVGSRGSTHLTHGTSNPASVLAGATGGQVYRVFLGNVMSALRSKKGQ